MKHTLQVIYLLLMLALTFFTLIRFALISLRQGSKSPLWDGMFWGMIFGTVLGRIFNSPLISLTCTPAGMYIGMAIITYIPKKK